MTVLTNMADDAVNIIENLRDLSLGLTAIPYRASTGPEQGFPCVIILTGKNPEGIPLLIAGIMYSLKGFPGENCYTGRSL